jgi:hypothetical protein
VPLPLSSEPVSDETVAETYNRVTGKDFSELPVYIQKRFAFLPPDADMSDIEFDLYPDMDMGLCEYWRVWDDA